MPQTNLETLAIPVGRDKPQFSGTLGQRVTAILSITAIVKSLSKIIKHFQRNDRLTFPLIKAMRVHTSLDHGFRKSINYKISVQDIATKDGRELIKDLAQPGIRIRMNVMYNELTRLITALNQLSATETVLVEEVSGLKQSVLLHLRYLELLIAERYNEV